MSVDVTDEQRLEAQLRHAQKMEAIGRLAGSVAHDFNNVLSVILSLTSMILGDLKQIDPLRIDLESIKKAGERGADLTRQLLALSRQQVISPRTVRHQSERARSRADAAALVARRRGAGQLLRAWLVEGARRPRPDRSDHFEPGHQRPGRHARRRQTHHRNQERRARSVIHDRTFWLDPRSTRDARRQRHWDWHVARDAGPHFRAVLYDQRARQRDWPRAIDRLWHRQAVRREHLGLQRARRWHDVPRVLPRVRGARHDRTGAGWSRAPCKARKRFCWSRIKRTCARWPNRSSDVTATT